MSQWSFNINGGNILLGITTCVTNVLRDIRRFSVDFNHIPAEMHIDANFKATIMVQGDRWYRIGGSC